MIYFYRIGESFFVLEALLVSKWGPTALPWWLSRVLHEAIGRARRLAVMMTLYATWLTTRSFDLHSIASFYIVIGVGRRAFGLRLQLQGSWASPSPPLFARAG